jgi:hypothetical protein
MVVNDIAARLGVKHLRILQKHLFYRRHKLISAIKQIDFEQFDGIVEVNETYFLYSQKGKHGISERNKPRKRGGKSAQRD